MFRKQVAGKNKAQSDHIAWRGHEVTRIEAFSDAVFAFALTLLIMSLEVPHNYKDLMKAMHFVLPFGVCFVIIMFIWYQQNIFFRRFGLHDFVTISLNSILMFAVLVYMFPLKFLIGGTLTNDFHIDAEEQLVTIFMLYSGGFVFFYFLFGLMYANAIYRKDVLNLTAKEVFAATTTMCCQLLISGVGAVSLLVCLAGAKYLGFAGMSYALIGPCMYFYTARREKQHKKLFGDETNIKETLIADVLEAIPDDELN